METPKLLSWEEEHRIANVLRSAIAGRSGSVLGAQPPPGYLYHYTTPTGLQGIASRDVLWATDVRFMNDASELTYASAVVDETLTFAVSEIDDDWFRDASPRAGSFVSAFEWGPRPFATCFCEQGDLLSQWRGYDEGQTGYCLGLRIIDALAQREGATLRKVIYDAPGQQREVYSIFESWRIAVEGLFQQQPGLRHVFSAYLVQPLHQALLQCQLCFKHPAFSEEREWRLIKLVDVREEIEDLDKRRLEHQIVENRAKAREFGYDFEWQEVGDEAALPGPQDWHVKFRPTLLGLAPYIELRPHDQSGLLRGKLPIWEVIQGPSAHPELGLESLTLYLRSAGYGRPTSVAKSGIPLRRR